MRGRCRRRTQTVLHPWILEPLGRMAINLPLCLREDLRFDVVECGSILLNASLLLVMVFQSMISAQMAPGVRMAEVSNRPVSTVFNGTWR